MDPLKDILRELGIVGKSRKKSGGSLPNPDEVKEKLEEMVDKVSELKDVPKALVDRLVEADSDFRNADKSLRGARLRGKRR